MSTAKKARVAPRRVGVVGFGKLGQYLGKSIKLILGGSSMWGRSITFFSDATM